jgi:hypothetical protein
VRKLRQQWTDLSLEKKLGFAVPLVIACVTGVVVPVFLAGGSGSGPQPPNEESELEIVDLAVTGGQLQSESPAAAKRAVENTQALDITVRNAGELVSVMTAIGFRILDAGFLQICQAGGGLEPSESYDVQLPATAEIEGDQVVASPDEVEGKLVEDKLSQEIRPGQADRFLVRLDVAEPERQLGSHLYQLEVVLYHDGDPEPTSAGNVLVSVPFLPNPFNFWSSIPPEARRSGFRGAAGAAARECYQRNDAVYKEMLALDGERSPELTLDLMQPQ